MAKDATLYAYAVRFEGRAIDERRFREVVERNFGVRGMTVERTALVTPEQLAALRPRGVPAGRKPRKAGPPARAQRLLALLDDGKPWTVAALKRAAGGKQVSAYLVDLIRDGLVSRIEPGVYCKAGCEPAHDRTATRLPKRGSAEARVHDLLAQAMTLAEIGEEIGRSRNTVDGILKRLVDAGHVVRIESGGEAGGRHLYVRADVGADGILSRTPKLNDSDARILSSLSVGEHHTPADVADRVGMDHGHVADRLQALAKRGLVEFGGMSGLRVAALTDRGVRHPQYEPGAGKAAPFDTATRIAPATRAVVRALAILGAATTAEITKSSAWEGRIGLGQTVAALRDRGYVATDAEGGRFRRHRLTRSGLALSKLLANAPLASGTIGARRNGPRPTGPHAGPRKPPPPTDGTDGRLLALLERDGPLTAPEARRRLGHDDLTVPALMATFAALEEDGRVVRSPRRDRGLIRWQLVP